MTSLGGLALVAAAELFLHVVLSADLFGIRLPFLGNSPSTSRKGRRRSAVAVGLGVGALLVIQYPAIVAVIRPDQVSGPLGVAIGTVELLLAVTWILVLARRAKRDRIPTDRHTSD